MGIIFTAMLLFDLPMRGSWAMLLLSVSLFLFGALAWGLLISTIADTQQVLLRHFVQQHLCLLFEQRS